MTSKKPVMIVLAVLLLAGLFATSNVQRAYALSQGVSLDAANTSLTDILVAATATNTHAFRVGAVLTNTSGTNPINTVYGWQFTIGYNASAFIPQGDPSATSLYADGSANTVLFGAGGRVGAPSWQGLINANQAFGSSTISSSGVNGQITVFFTILAPNPAVTITAQTTLASVSFELLPGRQVAAYSFTISNVIFVDNTGAGIPGPTPGAGATETITDNPPVARVTATSLPNGDASCVAVTGVNCSAYAFSFDASASSDPDGTIANPAGFFYDWGDGTMDSPNAATLGVCTLLVCNQGAVAIHDYSAQGKFNATLRVIDNSLNTGAARDSLGSVILNNQPSHTQLLNLLADQLPTAAFTATPSTGPSPLTVNFDGIASTDPDGTVVKYFWNFGDSSPVQTTTTATTSHVYTVTATTTFTASLIVQDNTGGNSTSTTRSIMVTAGVTPHPTTTTIACSSPLVINQGSTCTVTVTDTSATGATTPTGTVSLGETGVTGAFTTCTLSGTTASATCTSTFTASTSGTASVTANYPGDSTHVTSSGTTSIVVNQRATTTTVSCTTPVVLNQGSTCTVTVTDTSPGTFLAPTGTVALGETGVTGSFTTCTLSGSTASATCTSTFTATTSGTAAVTASYPGDTSHATSSGTTSITVNPRVTTTTVSCTTPVVINQGSVCSVTVTDTSPGTFITPTGTVALTEIGVTGSFTTCTLSGTTAAATCTSTFTATTSGTASVSANFPADTTHGSSSGTTSIVVNLRVTTTSVTCTTPVVINQGSTCNVTVADVSPGTPSTPTGTVSLGQTGVTGTFTACTLAGTTASATCTSTFTASTSGTASVTAPYPGDTSHGSSSGTASVVVNLRTTTTSVSCTTPVIVNQGSTCTVTVTDTSVAGTFLTPTGTVSLGQTGVTGTFTTCTLAGATASATCTSTFTATTSGTASVTASYPGNPAHSLSSGTTSIVVNTRPTTTTVSCSPTSISPSQTTTCTATVNDPTINAGTQITPTGTVTFTNTGAAGTFTGSPCTLVAGTLGTASCQVTFTAGTGTGTANIVGNYNGDSTHASSVSTSFPVTIGLAVTTTTVSCTTPVVVNEASTCNVSVTDTSTTGATTPTGTVTLAETGVTGSFTTCSLSGTTATATCTSTFTATTSGTASVTASYPGDTTHGGSQGTTSITVNPRTTTTTVSCTTPVNVNEGSICNVIVADTSTAGTFLTPTGIVTLSETGVTGSFTTCTLAGTTASATCTSTFTASTPGTASVTASYPGDTSHAASSGTTSVTVNAPVGVPIVTVNNPTPNPATTGQTVTVTFTVSSTATVTGITVNWGDGTTPDALAGTATSDTHVYTSTGNAKSQTFAITVTATNSAGPGSGTTTEVVNDLPPVVTISSITPPAPFVGQSVTVSFTATDPDGTVSSISVDWGDNTAVDTLPGTATSDTHTYTAGGSFTITIIATDNSGSTGQATGSITVAVPVGVPTVTVNSPTPNPAMTGQTVTVTFTVSSTDTVTGIMVNWGDGTAADILSGTATSDTHVYASTGTPTSETFTITVTATNSAGPGSGTTTETVNDRPPVASFTFTPPSPSSGQTVSFDASASADPDGTIVSYAWDFGDGTTGTGANPTHVYSPAATTSFIVMLTVTDNSGSTGSTSQSITVSVTAVNPPVVTITGVVPNPANTGQIVNLTFTVSSTATVTGVTVDWGDGTVSDSLPGTATSDTHNYANTGNAKSQIFTITVTATNSGGAGLATTTETINDRPPVVTISTVTPNPANTGQTVALSFTASDPDGTISSITVNWGDGSTPDTLGGTATSDTHSYTTAGNFTITVTATDNSGSTGAATTIETVRGVTTTPILLTFQAFNFTAFHNGFGSFQVLVNGHVVDVVNIPFVRSATISNADSALGANRFVNFGPFDITAFVVQGQNNITFVNPTSSRFSLIKNVVIMQDNTIFLNVTGARFVSPGRPVTFTFSNPPLTITSFTTSDSNPFVEQHVTFTATYTGGTGPFKCLFRFGNGNLWGVQGKNGSCNVTTEYHFPGTFTATVRITGSTTADRQTMTLPTQVTVEPDTVFTTNSQDIASQSETANNLHSFSLTVTNPSSHTIVFRVDVLVTRPDGSQTWVIGQSYTLQPAQTTTFSPQSYPPAGQHGLYNFKAALKFGIDDSNDGILQNSEKIVTSGYLFGNFTVP